MTQHSVKKPKALRSCQPMDFPTAVLALGLSTALASAAVVAQEERLCSIS